MEHARDIHERRTFEPALPQGPARLAFQIRDHEILARVEHLPEMKISVDANFSRRQFDRQKPGIAGQELRPAAQHLLGEVGTPSPKCGNWARSCRKMRPPPPRRAW